MTNQLSARCKTMKENKIVIKIGLIENGNLFAERVLDLEWPDNWTPDFEKFYNELIAWAESDMNCMINKVK